MTLANKNHRKILEPIIEEKLKSYLKTHPDLTDEEIATIKVVLSSIISSEIIKRKEQRYNLTHVLQFQIN